MNVVERAIVMDCQGSRLIGVLTQPERPSGLAVLVIVGGPQYRIGSHRAFVHVARQLARDGYPVMRFDVRGMGDSDGAPRSFEDIDDDIATAANTLLAAQSPDTRLVLWGLCDGASAAMLYLDRRGDGRVAAVALLNPWVRSPTTLARTQVRHYYGQRLLQREFWRKLLHGGVGWKALSDFVATLRTSSALGSEPRSPLDFRQRMARQWMRFRGELLLMLSEHDYTAREFEECLATLPDWGAALSRQGLQVVRLDGADHTLSSTASSSRQIAELRQWLSELRVAVATT